MTVCISTIQIPPFDDERRLQCQLMAEDGHALCVAIDGDGIRRTWPRPKPKMPEYSRPIPVVSP